MKTIYGFLDEGGNLDFSRTGTRFFSLSCVSMQRPFTLHTQLDTYKYDLIEFGLDVESFHCTNDNTHVRRHVFEILSQQFDQLRVDSLSHFTPRLKSALWAADCRLLQLGNFS